MTNPNVIRWIGSVEKIANKKQYERPFHQNEQQFYLFHPPMPTENGMQLKEHFNERKKIEKEKSELQEKEKKLVYKFDSLNKSLKDVMQKPAETPEDQMKKTQEINAIQKEIKKVTEDLKKVREEIKEKDDLIDKENEKINELTEIVIEEEHNTLQQQKEADKENNSKEAENLISLL